MTARSAMSGHRSIALAILGCAVTIAACGSGGKSTSTSRAVSQAIKFAACMRSNGVPSFPDENGGPVQQLPMGVKPSSPAFQSAQRICSKLLPSGGPSEGAPSEQAHAELLKLSTCMRAHSVSGFPDPATGSPPAPGSSYQTVIGRGGYFLAIPSSIEMASPAFKRAAAACHFGPGAP